MRAMFVKRGVGTPGHVCFATLDTSSETLAITDREFCANKGGGNGILLNDCAANHRATYPVPPILIVWGGGVRGDRNTAKRMETTFRSASVRR